MPTTTSGMPRFLPEYEGIQGLLMLSDDGTLGHLRMDDASFVAEELPERRDADFVAQHHSFPGDVKRFQEDLQRLLRLYRERAALPLELGHVEPGERHPHAWHSASLVINRRTRALLLDDEEQIYHSGERDRFDPALFDDRRRPLRGIHRGMEDLLEHRSPAGDHRFFPVLYYQPGSMRSAGDSQAPRAAENSLTLAEEPDLMDQEDQPSPHEPGLRVLNLFWAMTSAKPVPGNWCLPFGVVDTQGLIFKLLRQGLYERGAIDPGRRREHRFSLA